jgi:hypothetical protein
VTDQTGVLPWWGEQWHKPAFLLFLLCWGVAMVSDSASPAHWPQALLLITAMVTTLVTLGRQLPLQNVVLITLVIGAASVLWTLVVQRSFDASSAILWTIIVLNARGGAQWAMCPSRGSRYYGWGLLAIAGAVSALFGGLLYRRWTTTLSGALETVVVLFVCLPLFMNKRPAEPPVSLQPLIVLPALQAWLFLR